MVYVYLLCIILGFACFMYCAGLLLVRRNMLKNDKAFRTAGLSPEGSSLRQGMTITEDDELVADEQAAALWYSRLFKAPL